MVPLYFAKKVWIWSLCFLHPSTIPKRDEMSYFVNKKNVLAYSYFFLCAACLAFTIFDFEVTFLFLFLKLFRFQCKLVISWKDVYSKGGKKWIFYWCIDHFKARRLKCMPRGEASRGPLVCFLQLVEMKMAEWLSWSFYAKHLFVFLKWRPKTNILIFRPEWFVL